MSVPLTFNPPIERIGVLSYVKKALDQHSRVLLSGPAGVGKSVIIDQILTGIEAGTTLCAYPTDASVPYSTLSELLCDIAPENLDELTPARADAVATLLRRNHQRIDQLDTVALSLGVRDLIGSLTADHDVWLIVDAVDHTDTASLKLLAQLWKHLPGPRLKFIMAARQSGLYRRLGVGVHHEIGIPLWDLAETVEVLAGLQLPNRQVASIHRASGGRVDLALRIGGEMRPNGPEAPTAPTFGPAVETIAHEQLADLSTRVQHTLLYAALALHPTEALLQRAGRTNAHEDLAEATRQGLATVDVTGAVTFHAESTTEALYSRAAAATVKRAHRKLAGVSTDPAAITRHRALATDGPQPELVAELDDAADVAKKRGDPTLAAELNLLAADHTPADDAAEAITRLVNATQLAASAGRSSLVERAARSIFARQGDPSDRLKAQLAIIDAAGQDLGQVREMFVSAAGTDADPALQAELTLWHSWRTYITDGNLNKALGQAREAQLLAAASGSNTMHMQTLTMVARLQRLLGEADTDANLELAYELCPEPDDDIPGSAAFVHARHALFDDDLAEARAGFAELLPLAKQHGDLKALTEVLRSLAEVELRAGNCHTARSYIDRAMSYVGEADLSMSPIWYVSAQVETFAGDHARAKTLARHGLAAAQEDHDVVFTARNHYVLGQLSLLAGNPAAALEDLAQTQRLETELGVHDPSILPWQPDLAEALVRTGDLPAASSLISRTRHAAQRLGRDIVELRLDAAESSCEVAQGHHETAAELLQQAIDGFRLRGLRIDLGRAQLAMALLERRRRRRSAARSMLDEAEATFSECHAEPWMAQVAAERRVLDCANSGQASRGVLTPGEARIAKLVSDGASNRQTATALNVSVKTIETRLSRIYRKLGIQTRTQLATQSWDTEE